MKIYFATSNKGKVANVAAALKPFNISVEQIEMELAESRSEDPKDIALEKARQAFKKIKKALMVEDSGFFISALNGFPMTHIKFSLKTLGLENIMKLMAGVTDRRAEWRMTAAYVFGENDYRTFTFVERGEIAPEIRPVKRPTLSDLGRIYVPKTISNNKLALSEMPDEIFQKFEDHYNTSNQFLKLGRWVKNNLMK